MLGTNRVMTQAAGLIYTQFEHFLSARSQAAHTGRGGSTTCAKSSLYGSFDQCRGALRRALSSLFGDIHRVPAHIFEIKARAQQSHRSHTLAFAHQAKQQMFSTDIVMAEFCSFLVRKSQNFAHAFGKLIEASIDGGNALTFHKILNIGNHKAELAANAIGWQVAACDQAAHRHNLDAQIFRDLFRGEQTLFHEYYPFSWSSMNNYRQLKRTIESFD